jgi:hypothetical protein
MTPAAASRRLVVAVAVALTLARPALATTYYVDPHGRDGADGRSPSTAWASVDRVDRARLEPGDRVLFAGGATFAGRTLEPPASGTPGHPIVFGSYGSGRATIENHAGAVALPAGASWLRFVRLRLSSEGAPAAVFRSAGAGPGSRAIVVDRCVLTGTGGAGVSSPRETDASWTIRDSTIAHTGDSGIIALGARFEIAGNRIVHTGWSRRIPWGKHGVYAKGPGIRVEGNTIVGFTGDGISLRFDGDVARGNTIRGGPIGVGYFDYSPRSGLVTIAGNRIEAVTQAGVYVDAGTEADNDGTGPTHQSFTIAGNRIAAGAVAIDVRRTRGRVTIERNTISGARGLSLRVDRPAGRLVEARNTWLGGTPRFASDGRVYDTLAEWRRTGLGAGDRVRPAG